MMRFKVAFPTQDSKEHENNGVFLLEDDFYRGLPYDTGDDAALLFFRYGV